MMATRAYIVVAVTAGGGRDVHLGSLVMDSDHDRPYTVSGALCGSDSGRRGSVRAWAIVDDAPLTCGKCLARRDVLGDVRTWDRP